MATVGMIMLIRLPLRHYFDIDNLLDLLIEYDLNTLTLLQRALKDTSNREWIIEHKNFPLFIARLRPTNLQADRQYLDYLNVFKKDEFYNIMKTDTFPVFYNKVQAIEDLSIELQFDVSELLIILMPYSLGQIENLLRSVKIKALRDLIEIPADAIILTDDHRKYIEMIENDFYLKDIAFIKVREFYDKNKEYLYDKYLNRKIFYIKAIALSALKNIKEIIGFLISKSLEELERAYLILWLDNDECIQNYILVHDIYVLFEKDDFYSNIHKGTFPTGNYEHYKKTILSLTEPEYFYESKKDFIHKRLPYLSLIFQTIYHISKHFPKIKFGGHFNRI